MILPLLARFWPYIAIVCLAGALWLSVKHSGALSERLDNAIEIANQNALIAEQERKERERVNVILTAYQKKAAQRSAKFNQQRSEAHNAQDGILAPVLRGVLNGLPERPHAAGGNEG